MLESAYTILLGTTKIPNLSEQFLVSCDKSNSGCLCGNTAMALEFLKNTTGTYFENEFPYND